MIFLDYIRGTEIYKALCPVHDSNEGNTLEIIDPATAEAQIEFHRWALAKVRGEWNGVNSFLEVLEVGTNKGMFGLLLWHIDPHARLTTMDVNPDAKQAVEFLREFGLDARFYLGSSIDVLPELLKKRLLFDYAWIDGDHEKA